MCIVTVQIGGFSELSFPQNLFFLSASSRVFQNSVHDVSLGDPAIQRHAGGTGEGHPSAWRGAYTTVPSPTPQKSVCNAIALMGGCGCVKKKLDKKR